MGFRFRKSINLPGGFRVNASKSGLSYSWGTKGYRITKTAKGATRRTITAPGTGLSYSEETGGAGGEKEPDNRPGCGGCLIKIIAIPLVILLVYLVWFLVFRAPGDSPQPSADITANPNVIITQTSKEEAADSKERKENVRKYLDNLGFDIVENQGSKITVTYDNLAVQDTSVKPENWEEIKAKFLETSEWASKEMEQDITLYLFDAAGTHYLTAISGNQTYDIFDVETKSIPHSQNKYQ